MKLLEKIKVEPVGTKVVFEYEDNEPVRDEYGFTKEAGDDLLRLLDETDK